MKPVQIRMARAALGWSVEELAERSGLSASDIERSETGTEADPGVMATLRNVLTAEGVMFLDATDTLGPGVRYADGRIVHDTGLRPDQLNASNDD